MIRGGDVLTLGELSSEGMFSPCTFGRNGYLLFISGIGSYIVLENDSL